MTKSKSIPTVVHHNTTVANNDKDSATLFNQYFHSAFNHVISDLPEPSSLSPHPNPISSVEISEEEVYEALTQVDPNKATGMDSIGPKRYLKTVHCLSPYVIYST